MNSLTSILLGLTLLGSALPAFAEDDLTTDQIFSAYEVTDPAAMTLTTQIYDDSFCGGKDYYINLTYAGVFQAESYKINILLQTATQEQQDLIAAAIRENFATKGLPDCVKKEPFRSPNISYVLKQADFQPVLIPAGICSGFPAKRPFTTCILSDKIYD